MFCKNRMFGSFLVIFCMVATGWGAAEDADTTVAITGSLGVNGSRGNSEAVQAVGSLGFAWEREKTWKVEAGASAAYGEANSDTSDPASESETNTQTAEGFLNTRRRAGKAYGYANVMLRHDDIADVDYRLNVGPGIGLVIYEAEGVELNAEIGGGYLWEQVGGVNDDYPTLRVAAEARKAFGDAASIWLKGQYVPNAEDIDEYELSGEAGIQASVTAKLGLRLTIKEEYQSMPASGREHNDLTYASVITWKL